MRLSTFVIAIVLFAAVLISARLVIAGQQYNPLEDRWETAPERYQLQYNPFENEWSYEPPRAGLEYNPFEDSWDWNPEPSLIQPYPCDTEYDLHHHGESY